MKCILMFNFLAILYTKTSEFSLFSSICITFGFNYTETDRITFLGNLQCLGSIIENRSFFVGLDFLSILLPPRTPSWTH
ncbi:hypothetical protein ES288_D03G052700v1 [Gossypium darwinii]|uniref:Secreted protein n=1 Tax=Gossypium darwinii TaxID=34276 RepID=A0A5D2D4Y9_GOSDA|nr:hypothetical protein ES288_D03G052700v1 [Gossypium darwinii]